MDVRSPANPPQGDAAASSQGTVSCPYCGHEGTLAPMSEDTIIDHNVYISVRRCLNEECGGIMFYYRGKDGHVKTLPYRGIDEEKRDTPAGARNALEEATICYANGCYAAAAIMIRRALAELCHDLGIADGDLSSRLDALGEIIVMPPALLAGLRNLRMLGSAAAESESAVYGTVSREEVQVGIECAGEIMKALYRYQSLVGRLEALKEHRATS